jgi:membrane-associated phospholipid phosphatase
MSSTDSRPDVVTARPARTTNYYAFDRIVIGYCALMILLLLLLGRPLKMYFDEVAFHAGAGALAFLIVRKCDERRGGWEAFLRLLYPALMFIFFYRATGGLMHLVYPGFHDAAVVAFEKRIFGTNPTLFFDQRLLKPWRSEIFMFCYGSYYLMLPVFLIPVFLRRDYVVIREFMAAASLTFFLSYLLFVIYPVAGPRWHLASEYLRQVHGPVFTKVVQFIMSRAAVLGGAMPSSHTAVALVVLAFCYRYYFRFGLILTPIVTGLAVGAVWGRFHYVSDIVVGAAIGIAAVVMIRRFTETAKDRAGVPVTPCPNEAEHVS